MGKFALNGTTINQYFFGGSEVGQQYLGPLLGQGSGGDVSYDGDYAIHTFTASGEFTVSEYNLAEVEILVVAGGGAGQSGGNIAVVGGYSGAGGGAGGVVYIESSANYTVAPSTYTITVGTGSAPATFTADNGQDSSFIGGTISLTALGGGGVASISSNTGGSSAGVYGGVIIASCGAGSPAAPIATQPTASGDSGTYGFGNNGGLATNCVVGSPYTHLLTGGGGGGAGGAASTTTGGAGKSISITGTPVTYAIGGTANSGASVTGYGSGGNGGTVNTNNPSAGNSGVVIVRYKYQA